MRHLLNRVFTLQFLHARNVTTIYDNTANIKNYLRRLDTLSRFLELSQKCVAITVVEDKLFVSTNKMKHRIDEYDEHVQSIKKGFLYLRYISESINYDQNNLYNILLAAHLPTKSDTDSDIDNWACEIDKKNNNDNLKTTLEVFSKKPASWTPSVPNYLPHMKYLLEILGNHRDEKVEKIFQNLTLMHNRSKKDAEKIVDLMQSDNFPEIKDLILNSKVKVIPSPVEVEKGKNPHAEMNIIQYVMAEYPEEKNLYIGISKKSCFACELDLKYVGEMLVHSFGHRGSHGVEYTSRQDTEFTKLSREKYSQYKPIASAENVDLLFGEISDSEIYSSEDGEYEPMGEC